MSVWSKEHNPETSIKRNVFPQSFCNNLTFNFGSIVPFFWTEVASGDTWTIDTAYGFRFWPTAFPLQNRIRLDGHFFYVRWRNLYKDFKEWYTNGTVDKPMPFLANRKPEEFKNGSLMDYMNVPTVVNFSDGDMIFSTVRVPCPLSVDYVAVYRNGDPTSVVDAGNLPTVGEGVEFQYYALNKFVQTSYTGGNIPVGQAGATEQTGRFFSLFGLDENFGVNSFSVSNVTALLGLILSNSTVMPNVGVVPVVIRIMKDSNGVNRYFPVSCGPVSRGNEVSTLNYTFDIDSYFEFIEKDPKIDGLVFVADFVGVYLFPLSQQSIPLTVPSSYRLTLTLNSVGENSVELSAFSPDRNPFIVGEDYDPEATAGKIPLNALPFRAYEQIYNAFFRDERNNPLIIDGKPYYDKYLKSTDGGADSNEYTLRRRNWEQDFLTTALPSPQQGEAPLVGISATGVMSISDENGNVYHAQAVTADDNDTIVGAKFIQTNQDGTSIPSNVARSLVSYATSGISINDFRNVNALQRYLETNLRRGLKYRDLVAARWGVNISYAEMNMPEFIGGFTEYVVPSQVNQTSQDTSDSPLGSFAGQLHCQGNQKHKIRHFCDEDGFIIGVVSCVPVPTYSQLLPKFFTKFDPLDFFQPEFGHIGMQPIPMKEVAPLQVALAEGNQDETFGYQRAWYDYLGRVDEVHGQMRGPLRDYLMYRTFSGIPRLNEDFLLVDNKPLDNVFTVQRDADGNSLDKIVGQIYVDAVSKRPIPRFGTPRLE